MQIKQPRQRVLPQVGEILYALVHDAEGAEIGYLSQYTSGRVGVFLNDSAGIHRGHKLLRNAQDVAQFLNRNIRGARFTRWVMPQA
jgi:hypothetical protein